MNHAELIRSPLLLLQGADDKIVPPAQSERIANAMRRHGRSVELIIFAGEGHGFRMGEHQRTAIAAEYACFQNAATARQAPRE